MTGVRNFVARGEKRSQRRECVRALALHPLTAAFQLKSSLGVVVVQRVARDVIERVLLRNISSFLPDDKRQLHFPIQFRRTLWYHHVVVRTNQGARRLEKNHGL